MSSSGFGAHVGALLSALARPYQEDVTLPGGDTEPMTIDERPEAVDREFGRPVADLMAGRMGVFYAAADTAARETQLLEYDGSRWLVHARKRIAAGGALGYALAVSAGAED